VTDTLEELEKLLKAGTPGPWGTAGRTMVCSLDDAPYPELLADASQCVNADANAALIVAAINALPELVARVRELERENEDLRQLLSSAHVLLYAGQRLQTHLSDWAIDAERHMEATRAALKGPTT
jgi:cell division protein ZapA (FtsZ GTPase activity inhibitor)